MARHIFGGTLTDVSVALVSGFLKPTGPITLSLWSAETGGAPVTDLLLAGQPVTAIKVGSEGDIPAFEGPDGVTRLWVKIPGRAARRLLAAAGLPGLDGLPGGKGDIGPIGPPGPGTGAGAWAPSSAYTAGQVVQAPDGSMIRRNATGSSRASFDATERAAWTAVAAVPGTVENDALTATIAALAQPSTASGGLAQQQAAQGFPAMTGDRPTVTITTGTASPISGGVTLPWNTTRIRTYGCYPRPNVKFSVNIMDNAAAGLGTAGAAWAREIIVNDDRFAIRLCSRGATRFDITVDGLPTTLTPYRPAHGDGTSYWVLAQFRDARPRVIRIRAAGTAFAAFVTPTATTIAPARETVRGAIVHDSWGAGGSSYDGGWPTNYTAALTRRLGWNILNNSIGGSGVTRTPLYSDTDRRAAVLGFAPHWVIYHPSINDANTADPATVIAQAQADVTAYATDLPNTRVIIVAPQRITTATRTKLLAIRDGLASLAASAANVVAFVDPLGAGTRPWFTGSGTITSPNGTGNSDRLISSDGIHPARTGAASYAEWLAEAIALELEKAGRSWQEWEGAAIPDPLAPSEPLADIITTNLLVEIPVAAASGTTVGQPVASLTPPRGAHLDPLPAGTNGGPLYVNDADTAPALQFTGGRALASPSWTSPPAAGPFTLFVVYRVSTHGSGTAYLSFGPSATNRVRYQTTSTGQRGVSVNGGTTVTVGATDLGTSWRVEAIRFDSAGAATAWLSSLTPVALAAGALTLPNPGGIGIGGLAGGASGWDFSVRAELGYGGAMATADVERMLTFLAGKYGATLA